MRRASPLTVNVIVVRGTDFATAAAAGAGAAANAGGAMLTATTAAVPSMKGKEAFVAEVIALYNEYTYKGQSVLGAMDSERLARLQKFYVSQNIVPKESPLGDLYTNQFVQ